MLKNTKQNYGSIAKFFHWLIAALIIFMLFLGYLMMGVTVTNIHQITGLCILTLVACRLIWKLINPFPLLPDTVSKLEKMAAHTVQVLLYVCMFGMPLSGLAMSTAYGLIPHIASFTIAMPGIDINQPLGDQFKLIHNSLAYVLIALISLHILGALKHQFIDKDPRVLDSMLPRFKK